MAMYIPNIQQPQQNQFNLGEVLRTAEMIRQSRQAGEARDLQMQQEHERIQRANTLRSIMAQPGFNIESPEGMQAYAAQDPQGAIELKGRILRNKGYELNAQAAQGKLQGQQMSVLGEMARQIVSKVDALPQEQQEVAATQMQQSYHPILKQMGIMPPNGQQTTVPYEQLKMIASFDPVQLKLDRELSNRRAQLEMEYGQQGIRTGYEHDLINRRRQADIDVKQTPSAENMMPKYYPQTGELVTPAGPQKTPDISQFGKTKEQQAFGAQAGKDWAKNYAQLVETGAIASDRISQLSQVKGLLSNVEGGKLSPLGFEIASFAQSFVPGISKELSNVQAAKSLTRQLALELRNPGSGAGMPGALSDSDRKFLESMVPDIEQTKEGRNKIIDYAISVQKRNQKVSEMAMKYRQKYGSLDERFQIQLQNWANRNPLIRSE